MMPEPRTKGEIELSDEAFMEALHAGDDSALAPLMHRWELPLKAFILRLGVRRNDVDDVAQEAFVKLYIYRDRFRPGAPFKPWLLTLAGNLARNRNRWRFRRREDSYDDLFAESGQAMAEDSPSAHEMKAEELRAVRDAVAELPLPLREAVVCVELEQMSHAEASRSWLAH